MRLNAWLPSPKPEAMPGELSGAGKHVRARETRPSGLVSGGHAETEQPTNGSGESASGAKDEGLR